MIDKFMELDEIKTNTLFRYIENNISVELDTEHLSCIGYVSRSKLKNDFYSMSGHSVIEYVRKRRLSNALALIKMSDMGLADIAFQCGYSSHQALCRAVKQTLGITPTEVISLAYDGASSFNEGLAVVKKNGKWSILEIQTAASNLIFNQNDRYSFVNSSSNFGKKYTISDSDFLKLSNYVKNIYSTSSANSIINDLQKTRNSKWQGSCYGMAATSILDKYNQIKMRSLVSPSAVNLWQLPKPTNNAKIESAINYYQVSQSIPVIANSFDVPYSSNLTLPQKLEGLVNNAKSGKIMQFGFQIPKWGGHAIVITGYKQGTGNSHNVIAYDNNYPNNDTIINISADYKTCYVEPYRSKGAVSNIRYTADFGMYDQIKIDSSTNMQVRRMSMNTQISISAEGTTTITDLSGQTLIYNASTDEVSGTMSVLSVNYSEAGMIDGEAMPSTVIFEVDNSDSFTFSKSTKSLDVSVVGPDIYASASSEQSDTVIIAKNEGVSVLGNGVIDFSISLGLNNDVCDMISLGGSANQEASLKFNKDGAVAHGNFNDNTILTIFSNTSNIDEINFSTEYDEVLVTKQAGEFEVKVSSAGNGIFDKKLKLTDDTDKPSDWAIPEIEQARTLGLATSELDCNYQGSTTRAEFCRAAINFIEKYYSKSYTTILSERGLKIQEFSDTSDPIIGAAAALGITQGTGNNLFSPNLDLTREQAATMLNRVIVALEMDKNYPDVSWTDSKEISDWANQSINNIYALGVMNGTSTTSLVFSPILPYTHEQSIVTLLRLWKAINN